MRRFDWKMCLRFGLIALISTTLFSCRYFTKNLHTVDEGKFYRSAQLSAKELQKTIDKYKLKTVINLRGKDENDEWWLDEHEIVTSNGLAHINIRMSAGRLPHRVDLIALLDAYKTSERPILIHCKAGADRAGEASALYQILYMGKSKKEAAYNMLAMKYFHFTWFYPAKRYFILEVWQGEDWAYNEYDPCKADYKYYNKEAYCN